MAAAKAGVLGVRWLQRAARKVVPLGARTGPRESPRSQCWEGSPEVWCVEWRVPIVDTEAAESGRGRRWSWYFSEKQVAGLLVL